MDVACGVWGATECNTDRFFEVLGNASNNPFIPFQINYLNKAPEGKTVLTLETKPCNESYEVSFKSDVFQLLKY